MLRDAVGYTCEVKTAQETGESGGISSNHWEIGGNSGKIGEFRGIRGGGEFRGNWWISGEIGRKFWWNWGKIGELCFPNGETEFTDCEINFPHIREKRGKCGKTVLQKFPSVECVWNRSGKWKGISFSRPVLIAQYCNTELFCVNHGNQNVFFNLKSSWMS